MDIQDQLRSFQELRKQKFDDEKYKTATSIDQVSLANNTTVIMIILTLYVI